MKQILAVLAFALALVLAGTAWAVDTAIGRPVTTIQPVGGRGSDGGTAVFNTDSSGRVLTTTSTPVCASVVTRAISCGATPLTVPVSRAAGSTSLEVINSPENAGSPKVKCVVDPSDGGVGFGGTVAGLVRVPGESILFAIDSTHTVVCVCDTSSTALVTNECTP